MTVDGVSVDIPDNTEGLIFLNISHWGGGSDLWGVTFESDADPLLEAKRFLNPRIDDKMLEVAAVSSSFHLATITALPLNHATRLCQGAHIELVIEPENDMPIQVDGEPTTVKGCRVVISHHGQAVLLQDVM
jgi:diacylglycerol kinase (ATP)